jgi:hypothetical protein
MTKRFRVEDANAMVPRLGVVMERLQRSALRLHDEMRVLADELGVSVANLATEDLLRRRPNAAGLVAEIEEAVRTIEESGAVLKDIQLGLVDFPAEVEGGEAYLCWQFGEPEVAFWHRRDEGFAGRRPLPGPARTRWLQ